MKQKNCVRSMVLGAGIVLIGLAVGAIVSCGSGDDATKPNGDGAVITPKTTEPEADKENELAAVVEPAPQEPEPEPDLPAEEDVFLEQARDLLKKLPQRLEEEEEKNPEGGFKEVDRVYKEVLGIGFFFVSETLLPIHLEETPEEKGKFPKLLAPLILEYLRLSFKHPEKRENGLLRLFRQSSRDGNISVIPPNHKPKLE